MLIIILASNYRLFSVRCDGGFYGVMKEDKPNKGIPTYFSHICSIIETKRKASNNQGLRHCMTGSSVQIKKFLDFPPSYIRALWYNYRVNNGSNVVLWKVDN